MRAVKNLLCVSRVLSARQNAVIRMNSISYHCLEEPKLESFSSDWYEKAFSKLSMLSHLLNNVDVINGRTVNVIDESIIEDDVLLENMHLFKSLARDFIGCPFVQEIIKKNIIMSLGSNAKENQQLPCFNQAGEREPMTVDSLTKVSEILNISAQQRKVVRATICPQVTQHQIWTGALEVILDKLKSEMEYLDSKFPSKETKMAKQIVLSCLKVLDIAISYNPDSSSWMRVAPTRDANSPPTSHKWEDILEMFIDLADGLSEVSKLSLEIRKIEVMKEGLYQIRDIQIDKNIGYRENRHQESLVQKILTKRLGHSSRCLFTLLTYYLYGSVNDIEVEVRGGLYAVGHGDKFRLCMGKILTSYEDKMLLRGVKQLERALGLFKFIWETARVKGDLELQGHLWCIGTHSRSLTYRGTTFLLHGIDCFH
ncbi:unnamed protein product [Cuscuta europaea]|uniref:Uncharacterized protein n=3 Tax=Cuscuta europaea TaxID=41803 RepID=A0A9P0YVJ3_CUSEU|nr:unnamed protein product [Cuscuta europaea]